MARVKVKICGTTSVQNGVQAAAAGADTIGLIFAAGSKRQVAPAQAREIALAVGPTVARVGVFMNQSPAEVLQIADSARLSSSQLHGDLSRLYAEQLYRYYPVLLALRPQDLPLCDLPAGVTLLLDAPQPGSGQPLDWQALAPTFHRERGWQAA